MTNPDRIFDWSLSIVSGLGIQPAFGLSLVSCLPAKNSSLPLAKLLNPAEVSCVPDLNNLAVGYEI